MAAVMDWRGFEITVGCRVIFHTGDNSWGTWKLGTVTAISDDGWLDCEWAEDSRGASKWHRNTGRGIHPNKVTVWQETANVFAVLV